MNKNNMIQNMDVHAHAVRKETSQGISVLSLLKGITISQISIFVRSNWIDTGKETIKNTYTENVIMTWNIQY